MNSFKHSINERNKTNVLKLRMKHGAAGYGVYMMILERLAADPIGRQPLDYDILAFEFQVDVNLIKSVIEDFDLFIIDLDSDTFSHEEINRQLPKKAKQLAQETILNEFIQEHTSNEDWIDQTAQAYDISPQQLLSSLHTTFRTQVLTASETPNIPTPDTLSRLLFTHLQGIKGGIHVRD